MTSIDTFNQMFPFHPIGGDAGDWGINWTTPCSFGGNGGTGDVQDAFSCSNQSPNVAVGTPSFDALEAIGFNVPEPGIWALMLVGVGLVGAALRSPRRKLAGA